MRSVGWPAGQLRVCEETDGFNMGFGSDDRKQKMWRTNVRRLAGCVENRISHVCDDTRKWEACFVVI